VKAVLDRVSGEEVLGVGWRDHATRLVEVIDLIEALSEIGQKVA
jgi:hypothetical protein